MIIRLIELASMAEEKLYHVYVILSCCVVNGSLSESVLQVSRDSSINKELSHLGAFLIILNQSSEEDGCLLIRVIMDLFWIYIEPFKFLLDSFHVSCLHSLNDGFLLLGRRALRSNGVETESLLSL
jgi:hypothetical protein